ncbi:MAG: hypothetical protein OER88_03180 [Planctomycetota bacterium]|nr:hypothetical protein [Planctomycetota bacterium]
MRRRWHPWLFGIWPAIGAIPGGDVSVLNVVAAVAAGLAFAGLCFLIAHRMAAGPTRASLGASTLILAWFAYGPAHGIAADLNREVGLDALIGTFDFVRHRHLLPVWLLVFGVVFFRLMLTKRDLRRWTPRLNALAILLIVIAGARAAWPAADREAGDASDPDIYHLILDRYPRGDVFKTAYGFDNSPFLDWLGTRGFLVVDQSHCNYASTTLSVWSMLNMDYLPAEVYRAEVMRSLREGHAVADFVQERGYRYIHVGSHHGPLGPNGAADENPFIARSPSRYLRRFLSRTPLVFHFGDFGALDPQVHGDIGQFQFATLESLANTAGPKYVFAHILLPHSPMVFDKDGGRIANAEAGFAEEAKAPFVEQTKYTNTLLRRLVDRLLANRARPPVIILQAEEGPYLRGRDRELGEGERYRVRQGIFHALYLPGGAARVFGRDATPVNTYRKLFRHLFDATLETKPPQLFSWDDRNEENEYLPRVLRFFEITNKVAPVAGGRPPD